MVPALTPIGIDIGYWQIAQFQLRFRSIILIPIPTLIPISGKKVYSDSDCSSTFVNLEPVPIPTPIPESVSPFFGHVESRYFYPHCLLP